MPLTCSRDPARSSSTPHLLSSCSSDASYTTRASRCEFILLLLFDPRLFFPCLTLGLFPHFTLSFKLSCASTLFLLTPSSFFPFTFLLFYYVLILQRENKATKNQHSSTKRTSKVETAYHFSSFPSLVEHETCDTLRLRHHIHILIEESVRLLQLSGYALYTTSTHAIKRNILTNKSKTYTTPRKRGRTSVADSVSLSASLYTPNVAFNFLSTNKSFCSFSSLVLACDFARFSSSSSPSPPPGSPCASPPSSSL